jgi:hypothetical protein
MKSLGIALLGIGLLASGAVAAKQPPLRLPANANQFFDLYQGQTASATQSGVTAQDPRYPSDGLHPSLADRASSWHF